MQLQLLFKQGKYILIDVFKENKEWFDFFKDLNARKKYNSICLDLPIFLDKPGDAVDLEANWQVLKNQLNSLQYMGFNSPIQIGDKFLYDQKIHNVLHRIFTYSNAWFMQNYDLGKNQFKEGMESHPIDDKFVPSDVKLFLEIINNINIIVHKTEYANNTESKILLRSILNKLPDYYIWTQTHIWRDENIWFYKLTPAMKDIQFKYLDIDCDVYMSEEIQGKSYLRAFIDMDDPTKEDVTGRFGSYGSFIVDTTGNRKKIYQSKEFNSWLKLYDLDIHQVQLEWPLGKVVEKNFAYEEKIYSDFYKIKFL